MTSNKDLLQQGSQINTRSELRKLFKQYLKQDEHDLQYHWDKLTVEDGLPHNWIYDLYQAEDGRIFVGTWGGGLLVIDGDEWLTYKKSDGLHSNAVTCIREDQTRQIWVATDQGLNILSDNRLTNGGLAGKSLLNLAVDKNNQIWVGCWRAAISGGGLFRWDGQSWGAFTTRDGLPGQEILKVFQDSRGRIWVGTYEYGMGAGVGCYDGLQWLNYSKSNGLIDDCVYSMFEDPQGNLWFGTVGGVSIFDGTGWHALTTKDGLIDNRVYAMYIDSQQKMWFGTEQGLSRFDGENWLSFTTENGLVENLVRTILETKAGDLWFGSYPYELGRGGISIAKSDRYKSLTQRVLDLLPDQPDLEKLPSGDEKGTDHLI